MVIKFFAGIGTLLVIGAGCSLFSPSLEEKLVGTWGVKMEFSERFKQTPEFKSQEGMLQQVSETAKLELKSDKTFFQNFAIFQVEGRWEVKEKELHLYATKINGQSIEDIKKMMSPKDAAQADKPTRFRISEDATTLEALDIQTAQGGNSGLKVFWKKKATAK
ncbi:MAG: hypothetical protein QXI19_10175 [Candidatus Caldarchaeum sp.]